MVRGGCTTIITSCSCNTGGHSCYADCDARSHSGGNTAGRGRTAGGSSCSGTRTRTGSGTGSGASSA